MIGTDATILTPHPVLSRHYDHAADRHAHVTRLFDNTAQHYDRINSVLSFGTGTRYRRQALRRAGIAVGTRLLDVGTGTGVIACEAMDLVGPDGHVTAVDPSRRMLDVARRRGVSDVRIGTAEALPCDDSAYDMVTMGYALRHVGDLAVLCREFVRVLRPGGVLLILEQTPPRAWVLNQLYTLYMKTVVPRVSRLVTGSRDAGALMSYYWDSLDQCVPAASILGALEAAGLTAVRHDVVTWCFSEYTARRPAGPSF
ncbi:MAG: class I SAM-dependent methyltransferase [Planctomycetes bacterium]|nr:class I SAM-dependent methyltransferase [Planctomycetota bacterium]